MVLYQANTGTKQSIYLKLWISTLVPTRCDLISELSVQSFEKIWRIVTVACQEAKGWAEENEFLHRPVTNWMWTEVEMYLSVIMAGSKKKNQTTKKNITKTFFRCFLLHAPLRLWCCFCSWPERNTPQTTALK